MDLLIERIRVLLLEPKQAWTVIRDEDANTTEIVRNYLIYVAAVPPISYFIGQLLFASPRMPLIPGIIAAVAFYVLIFIAMVLAAFIINSVTLEFGIPPHETRAFRLVAYSCTAPLLASAFFIFPTFASLSVLGFYGIYLFRTGLPVLMECPEEKATPFTVVSVLIVVVLAALTFGITQLLTCR
jgi:hypothetical protein